jgi:hypothetical protein
VAVVRPVHDDGAVSTRPTERPLAWLNVGVKVALVALLLVAAFGDLQQFEGKATGARAVTYPLAAAVVPLAWLLRRRPRPYPHDVDVLLVLPFLIDTVGNALDLYDTVGWWDDANHLVNWAILVSAAGRALVRLPLGPLTVAGLAVGFGAVTAVLWELGEYVAFIRDSPELDTAYTDTLGDLGLGLAGSVLAAGLAAWTVRRRAVTANEH